MNRRPNTEGCTEQTCLYHGEDNVTKALHTTACPVRHYTGPLVPPQPKCTCLVQNRRTT